MEPDEVITACAIHSSFIIMQFIIWQTSTETDPRCHSKLCQRWTGAKDGSKIVLNTKQYQKGTR